MNADVFATYREFGERRREAAPGSLEHKSGGIILELCAEVDRQRTLSQNNLEAYWEANSKTSEVKRRAEAAEQERDFLAGEVERANARFDAANARAEAAEARVQELEADMRSVPVMELMRAYPADVDTLLREVERLTDDVYRWSNNAMDAELSRQAEWHRAEQATAERNDARAERDALAAEVAKVRAQLATGKPQATQRENDDAAARIKRIDELYQRYGLGGCFDVGEWPEYAQSEFKRLDTAQREYEAKYC